MQHVCHCLPFWLHIYIYIFLHMKRQPLCIVGRSTPWKTKMDTENHWLVEENTLPGGQDYQDLCCFSGVHGHVGFLRSVLPVSLEPVQSCVAVPPSWVPETKGGTTAAPLGILERTMSPCTNGKQRFVIPSTGLSLSPFPSPKSSSEVFNGKSSEQIGSLPTSVQSRNPPAPSRSPSNPVPPLGGEAHVHLDGQRVPTPPAAAHLRSGRSEWPARNRAEQSTKNPRVWGSVPRPSRENTKQP